MLLRWALNSPPLMAGRGALGNYTMGCSVAIIAAAGETLELSMDAPINIWLITTNSSTAD